MYFGFSSTMWYFPPQWSQHGIPSWYLNGMVFICPNEVNIVIPSGSLNIEALFSPLKSMWCSLVKPEGGYYIPVFAVILFFWFDYFWIVFFPVKLSCGIGICFLGWCLLSFKFSSWMWFSRVLTLLKLVWYGYSQCCVSALLAYTW